MKWTGQEELIGMLSQISPKLKKKGRKTMRFIHATYNMLHNCIDVTTFDGYVLRIDCVKAEERLKTTPCSECALNALAIDNPLVYATLYLECGMQTWVDAEDSIELW